MQNCRFKKNKLAHWFLEVKNFSRAKYLGAHLGDICYFQGTQETEANSLWIKISKGILKETTYVNTQEAPKVVSEDEGTMDILRS